jgi:hypothetical protein
MFHTENAGMLSESAVFALWMQLSRWWVVFTVVTGTLMYWVLCVHCARAVQKCPLCVCMCVCI